MNRRTFISQAAAVTAGSTVFTSGNLFSKDKHQSTAKHKLYHNPLPRWRGFNLMAFFNARAGSGQYSNATLSNDDLAWIRDWGFDYIRLPIDYWMFVQGNWRETGKMKSEEVCDLRESSYEMLDSAIEQCLAHGLHVTVNMHRCPGYCINGWELEPYNLFKSEQAQSDFVFHWEKLANRYKGIPSEKLSFNLLNEAPDISEKMSRDEYRDVVKKVVKAIRKISPERLIIADGTGVGSEIVPSLIDEPVAQAVHAYAPHELSHFEASWTPMFMGIDMPTWPAKRLNGDTYDRRHLELYLAPWGELVRQGVGVHCSEMGCYKHTPHDVFLRWYEDVLDIITGYDIGFAQWNFRGDFGILDSQRKDVKYEDWHGHRLDRKLLDLLLAH